MALISYQPNTILCIRGHPQNPQNPQTHPTKTPHLPIHQNTPLKFYSRKILPIRTHCAYPSQNTSNQTSQSIHVFTPRQTHTTGKFPPPPLPLTSPKRQNPNFPNREKAFCYTYAYARLFLLTHPSSSSFSSLSSTISLLKPPNPISSTTSLSLLKYP